MQRQGKHRRTAWKECTDTAWECRAGSRKAKALPELNWAKEVNNSNNGFYR